MPIWNIIDRRTLHHKWRHVTVIVEPTNHDNSVLGADKAPRGDHSPCYDERADYSLADAIAWVQSMKHPMTLYIYDLGDGISVRGPDGPRKLKASVRKTQRARVA
jgi:hypothetical protein